MTVLEKAQEIVDGDRLADYGHPIKDHGATAKMVSAYLTKRYGICIDIDAKDICAFNLLQKISRLAQSPDHRDSLVDICGYARNWEIISEPVSHHPV